MLLEINGVPNKIHEANERQSGWMELIVGPIGFDQPTSGIQVPTWWYNRRRERPGIIHTSGNRMQWVEEET